MLITKTLEDVRQLKRRANVKKKIGRYEEALLDLEQAINLLIPVYENIQETQTREAATGDTLSEVANEFADTYGTAGGIYQRLADTGPEPQRRKYLKDAKTQYERGAALETKHQLESTYCRSNLVVTCILLNPEQLRDLADEINQNTELLSAQVQKSRSKEWWAWADLALFNLLSNDVDNALRAYRGFKNAGAQAPNFDSHIDVLERLYTAISSINPSFAQTFRIAIDELKYLRPTL